MDARHKQAWEELARSINQLVVEEPFFGHLFGSIIRDVTTATPTMAVGVLGRQIVLRANPEFVLSLPLDRTRKDRSTRTGVLKHEALHLVFRHIFRSAGTDPWLYNQAADLVVNQYIAPWGLPPDAITLDTFPELDLLPNQSLQWYYDKLCNAQSSPPQTLAPSGDGSGAANQQQSTDRGDHQLWDEADTIDQHIAQGTLDRLIVMARDRCGPRGWARLPRPIRDLVTAAISRRQPSIDWRRVVRLFTASSRKTRMVNTLRRRSKRYGSYPGIRVRRHHRIAIAIDTSGSICDDDLSAFFSEIHAIHRQGATITILECDAAVQRTYPYRGKTPDVVGGGGGTAFDPVFQWLSQQHRSPYDACIYLTDGHGPAPIAPPPCSLLWVICADGKVGEHLRYGRVVSLAASTPKLSPSIPQQ